jgi:hypothetical protein
MPDSPPSRASPVSQSRDDGGGLGLPESKQQTNNRMNSDHGFYHRNTCSNGGIQLNGPLHIHMSTDRGWSAAPDGTPVPSGPAPTPRAAYQYFVTASLVAILGVSLCNHVIARAICKSTVHCTTLSGHGWEWPPENRMEDHGPRRLKLTTHLR